MKHKTILNVFRNSALCTAFLFLAVGVVDGKPDKGKRGNDDGEPSHSEKKNRGEKAEHKGQKDHGSAANPVDDKGHKNAYKAQKKNDEWRGKNFRDDDRTSVFRYFSNYSATERGLPPGLARNYLRGKQLPPGWQKKVYRGYVINRELNDYFHSLEYSLFPHLEAVPNTRLYLYGNRVVRVYEPLREVIDLIEVSTIRLD